MANGWLRTFRRMLKTRPPLKRRLQHNIKQIVSSQHSSMETITILSGSFSQKRYWECEVFLKRQLPLLMRCIRYSNVGWMDTHTAHSDRVETTKHSCRRLHIKYNQFARGFLQWQWQEAWRTRPKIQNTCSDHRIKIIKFKCFCMTWTRACANMHSAYTHEPD